MSDSTLCVLSICMCILHIVNCISLQVHTCTHCLYVNCFCTVLSTLSRISLTKAHVLWCCDNKSDLISNQIWIWFEFVKRIKVTFWRVQMCILAHMRTLEWRKGAKIVKQSSDAMFEIYSNNFYINSMLSCLIIRSYRSITCFTSLTPVLINMVRTMDVWQRFSVNHHD